MEPHRTSSEKQCTGDDNMQVMLFSQPAVLTLHSSSMARDTVDNGPYAQAHNLNTLNTFPHGDWSWCWHWIVLTGSHNIGPHKQCPYSVTVGSGSCATDFNGQRIRLLMSMGCSDTATGEIEEDEDSKTDYICNKCLILWGDESLCSFKLGGIRGAQRLTGSGLKNT